MLAFALLLVVQSKPELVAAFQVQRVMGGPVFAVAADGELVWGNAVEFSGNHGETDFARPFVLDGKKRYWLPLGGNEYGRVFAATSSLATGEVMVDYRAKPAIWKPHRDKGWSEASLSILKDIEGTGLAIRGGDVYIQNRETGDGNFAVKTHLLSGGVLKTISTEQFELVSVGSDGTLYGNRYTAIAFGGGPHDPKASLFRNGRWEAIANSELAAVNSKGVGVGTAFVETSRAAKYANGTTTLLALPKPWTYCRAAAINDAGDVGGMVGSASGSHAYLWTDRKQVDIGALLPKGMSSVQCMTSNTAIVAWSDREERRIYKYRW